jgi:mono/diheme cytochrome c family protein
MNLYFVPGIEVEIQAPKGENGMVWSTDHSQRRGGIVKRNYLILGMATLAVAGAVLAQDPPAKTSPPKAASHKSSAASAEKGKAVFDQKCAICHYADKDTKKIGPGLKGISKRGTFTVNGNKVTTEALTTWIENGDSLMPGMKETLEPQQIKDVVAYVKTL